MPKWVYGDEQLYGVHMCESMHTNECVCMSMYICEDVNMNV